MKRSTMNTLFAGSVVITVSVVACGGSGTTSSADSGVTLAAFQALQSQVAALQAQLDAGKAYNFINAPNGPKFSSASGVRTSAINTGSATPQSTTNACTGLGTFAGRTDDILHGYSCSGYYFEINGAAASSRKAIIQALSAGHALLFDGASCTGNIYITTNLSIGGANRSEESLIPNGQVFRYDPNGSGANDASTYYYVPAGATATDASIASIYTFNSAGTGVCAAVSIPIGTGDVLYAVLPAPPLVNGSSATMLPTAPISGPVFVGTY